MSRMLCYEYKVCMYDMYVCKCVCICNMYVFCVSMLSMCAMHVCMYVKDVGYVRMMCMYVCYALKYVMLCTCMYVV